MWYIPVGACIAVAQGTGVRVASSHGSAAHESDAPQPSRQAVLVLAAARATFPSLLARLLELDPKQRYTCIERRVRARVCVCCGCLQPENQLPLHVYIYPRPAMPQCELLTTIELCSLSPSPNPVALCWWCVAWRFVPSWYGAWIDRLHNRFLSSAPMRLGPTASSR